MRRLAVFIIALVLSCAPAAARAQGSLMLIRDEEIERILKAIGRPIFDQAGVSAETVRIVLVQDSALNAFVAGGQNIFLNTGLLLRAEGPEEVAGVMAHETGHIALGHLFRLHESVENMSMQSMLAGLLGVAVAVGTGSGEAGTAIQAAGQHIALRGILRHTRTQESSADEAGVRFLTGAGLPVTGFLSFMEKLADQELLPESQQSEYVRTHPLTQDRIDFLKHKSAALPPADAPTVWRQMHGRMQAKLTGFLFPDRALQNKSETLPARYARAIAWYRKGEMEKALALLGPLMKEEPENPWFQELKGQILFESGRIAEALPAYGRAVELAPDSGLIRAAYGHALLESRKYAEAVAQFQRAIGIEPLQPGTHRKLAIAYGKLGQEGLSRLHLAEEYVMTREYGYAKREALLALATLPKGEAGRLRAQDILEFAEKSAAEKKPRGR